MIRTTPKRPHIGSERLIALTDGVVAVVITIMVLELKPPHATDLASLRELGPTFLSFALSFVYVAIYWNDHHHFFRLVPNVGGGIMWANLDLLFWLSLIPLATAWMDEHGGAAAPVAISGATLLLCAISWRVMRAVIVHAQGPSSRLRAAIHDDAKGRVDLDLSGRYRLGCRGASARLCVLCRGRRMVTDTRPADRGRSSFGLKPSGPKVGRSCRVERDVKADVGSG